VEHAGRLKLAFGDYGKYLSLGYYGGLMINSVFAGLHKIPRILTYNTLSTSERSKLVPLLPGIVFERYLTLEQFWYNYGFTKNDLGPPFIVSFQFIWYEIVNPSGHEVRRPSGRLYRDDTGRKL